MISKGADTGMPWVRSSSRTGSSAPSTWGQPPPRSRLVSNNNYDSGRWQDYPNQRQSTSSSSAGQPANARAAPVTPPKALTPASQRARSLNRWSTSSRDARNSEAQNTPVPSPRPFRNVTTFADTQVHYHDTPMSSPARSQTHEWI